MSRTKNIIISTLIYLCVASIGMIIWLISLHMTVFNREVVKSWIVESSVYEKLATTFVDANPALSSVDQFLPNSSINQALSKTFTAGYVQSQTEKVIDAYYDWMEGKSKAVSFSISLNELRPEFQDNLKTELVKVIENAPTCDAQLSIAGTFCRPTDVTANDFADSLSQQAVAGEDAFGKPITDKSLAQDNSQDDSLVKYLPQTRRFADLALIVLPVFIAIALSIIVILAKNYRLMSLKQLSRKIFFGTIITVVAAAVLVMFSNTISVAFSSFVPQNDQVLGLIFDVVKTMIVAVGVQLLVIAVPVMLVAAASLIGLHFYIKKLNKRALINGTQAEITQVVSKN